MSKIAPNSYFIPRSLEQGDYFKTAKPLWKLVIHWILSHACYLDEKPYDINGSIIILKRGQVVFTLRQIAEDLKIDKNHVERAILHFSGFNVKRKPNGLSMAGKVPILVRQEVGQKVRQEKSVYNVMWDGFYISSETRSETRSEPASETRKRQERDINKKDKKEKEGFKEKEDSLSIDNSSSTPPIPQMGEERGRGKRKEPFKYKGQISHEAHDLRELSINLKVAVSADKVQDWIDELEGNIDLVKQQIEDVAELKRKGTNIISPSGLIGARVAACKSTFRPTLQQRTESNKEFAKRAFGTLELEGYQRISYGVDMVSVKHGKEQFQIFYAEPMFKEQLAQVVKFLEDHKKKIVNIKEA